MKALLGLVVLYYIAAQHLRNAYGMNLIFSTWPKDELQQHSIYTPDEEEWHIIDRLLMNGEVGIPSEEQLHENELGIGDANDVAYDDALVDLDLEDMNLISQLIIDKLKGIGASDEVVSDDALMDLDSGFHKKGRKLDISEADDLDMIHNLIIDRLTDEEEWHIIDRLLMNGEVGIGDANDVAYDEALVDLGIGDDNDKAYDDALVDLGIGNDNDVAYDDALVDLDSGFHRKGRKLEISEADDLDVINHLILDRLTDSGFHKKGRNLDISEADDSDVINHLILDRLTDSGFHKKGQKLDIPEADDSDVINHLILDRLTDSGFHKKGRKLDILEADDSDVINHLILDRLTDSGFHKKGRKLDISEADDLDVINHLILDRLTDSGIHKKGRMLDISEADDMDMMNNFILDRVTDEDEDRADEELPLLLNENWIPEIKGAYIAGHHNFVLYGIFTLNNCKAHCENQTSFQCKSVEFNPKLNLCFLSQFTSRSDGLSTDWSHFEDDSVFTEILDGVTSFDEVNSPLKTTAPECPDYCPPSTDYICDTNGNTYNSICEMTKFACMVSNENIQIQYRGKCGTNSTFEAPGEVLLDDTDQMVVSTDTPTGTNFTSETPTSASPMIVSHIAPGTNSTVEAPDMVLLDGAAMVAGTGAAMMAGTTTIPPAANSTTETVDEAIIDDAATTVGPDALFSEHTGENALLDQFVSQLCVEADEQCPKDIDPICDNKGNTHRNYCEMKKFVCLLPNEYLWPKHSGTCEGLSLETYQENIQHCKKDCGIINNPVCDNRGNTHINPCVIQYVACELPLMNIKLAHPGKCDTITYDEGANVEVRSTMQRRFNLYKSPIDVKLPYPIYKKWSPEIAGACITDNNNLVLDYIFTLHKCKGLCEAQTGFVCRSVEYNQNLKRCFLSEANSSNPSFSEHCGDFEEGGLFTEINDADLKGGAVTAELKSIAVKGEAITVEPKRIVVKDEAGIVQPKYAVLKDEAVTVEHKNITERYQGPFSNTFGDDQCIVIDQESGLSLNQCLSWCETEPACTAVNYNERHNGGSCVGRACLVPVPHPIGYETDPAWKGYSRKTDAVVNDEVSVESLIPVPNCPEICPDIIDFVCDSDGSTHDSLCHLNKLACLLPSDDIQFQYKGPCGAHAISSKVTTNCNMTCSDVSEPVCDNRGNTHQNTCWLAYVACMLPLKKIVMVHTGQCATGSVAMDESGSVNEAIDCEAECSVSGTPVCDNRGVTHDNYCKLVVEACKNPKEKIVMTYPGICRRDVADDESNCIKKSHIRNLLQQLLRK